LEEARPAAEIPPEKLEVALLPEIVVVAVPPIWRVEPPRMPAKVEVAVGAKIEPPVRVKPAEETSPPPATDNPELLKVEVAELVFEILPPVMVTPCDDANPPPPRESPPVKVEVPEPWA
jgi:hypothetical protein